MYYVTRLHIALGSALLLACAAELPGQALTLHEARERARRNSPDVLAAREAVAAAEGRARQTGAFPNPTVSYGREQTSRGGETNAQDIAVVEQPLELGGQRAARRDAARLRREAAAARLQGVELQVDFDVTRAYVLAVAADRRAELAEQVASAFASARVVSERRLAVGDVSGYANRRVRLEAARYAVLRAEALLARRSARLALASLIATSADSVAAVDFVLAESLGPGEPPAGGPWRGPLPSSLDSLRALALLNRPELRAAALEAEATAAEARVVRRERVPVPVVSAGIKREEVAGGAGAFDGLVAGVSLPLPLWDRRRGAVDAAEAEARQRSAVSEAVRRRTVREVEEAYDALRATVEQVALLETQLGSESRIALNAAQVAYSEGEIALVDWLDAVRAYQETEASYANLRADALVRRAALERVVGLPLPISERAPGASSPRQ